MPLFTQKQWFDQFIALLKNTEQHSIYIQQYTGNTSESRYRMDFLPIQFIQDEKTRKIIYACIFETNALMLEKLNTSTGDASDQVLTQHLNQFNSDFDFFKKKLITEFRVIDNLISQKNALIDIVRELSNNLDDITGEKSHSNRALFFAGGATALLLGIAALSMRA